MKILITFLGIGKYQPCSYRIGGVLYPQEIFFSHALAKHLHPDKVISLQTEEASSAHGEALENGFRELPTTHQAVRIPVGKSESELWEIFSALTDHIPKGSTLFIDITHGFRSLPILGLIALSYLRVTRNIEIGGIYYGAWEHREEDGASHAFDLTPFLALLDWTAAADQFMATGSADRIKSIMTETHQSLWQNKAAISEEELPRLLSTLGKTLGSAAQNLTLLRTGHLSESANAASNQLQRIEETVEIEKHARPFLELLEPVRRDLTRFGSTDMSVLRDLVAWLVEKERSDTALTLASEWLVSWVMVTLGQIEHHVDEKTRKPFADCLNLLIDRHGNNQIESPTPDSVALLVELNARASETDRRLLATISSKIKNARNDLNHAGFRNNPMRSDAIIRLAGEISKDLMKLPLPYANHP